MAKTRRLTQSVLRGIDHLLSFIDANDYHDSELRQVQTKQANRDINAAQNYLGNLVERKLKSKD